MFKEGDLVRCKPDACYHNVQQPHHGVVWAVYGEGSGCDATFLTEDGKPVDHVYSDEEVEVIEFESTDETHKLVWSKSSWHALTGKEPHK